MTQQPICLLGGPLIYVPILDNHFLSYFNPFCFSSMSSKRGRKRDDNLPFSQSREAQRDFRRRCRNHLEVCSYALAPSYQLSPIDQNIPFVSGIAATS